MNVQEKPALAQLSDQRIAERRIIFGPLADAFAALQLARPMAVLGTPRSAALLDDAALGAGPVHRFSGVRAHNPRESVDEALAFVDAHAARSVIAIGSSAAIDLGKAVAAQRKIVLALVPTALGGAEMSRGFGVLEGDRKAGGRLGAPPPIVVYDHTLLATLPARELGSIGINAWAHCIEAAYARQQHAVGGAAAIAAGRALPGLLRRAAVARNDALHFGLFKSAHVAGFALDARSMGLHHAVCHVIGGLTRFPHGINNAIVLPHAVRANARLAPDAVETVAEVFGFPDLAAEAEAIATAYALPRTFAELGAPPDVVERALPRVMEQPLLKNNPAMPDEETVRALLRAAYAGA